MILKIFGHFHFWGCGMITPLTGEISYKCNLTRSEEIFMIKGKRCQPSTRNLINKRILEKKKEAR